MTGRNDIPDHPEIARALLTGYPRPLHVVTCADCGEEFSGDRPMCSYGGDLICSQCFRDRIGDMSLSELAEAFGAKATTAENYLFSLEE